MSPRIHKILRIFRGGSAIHGRIRHQDLLRRTPRRERHYFNAVAHTTSTPLTSESPWRLLERGSLNDQTCGRLRDLLTGVACSPAPAP